MCSQPHFNATTPYHIVHHHFSCLLAVRRHSPCGPRQTTFEEYWRQHMTITVLTNARLHRLLSSRFDYNVLCSDCGEEEALCISSFFSFISELREKMRCIHVAQYDWTRSDSASNGIHNSFIIGVRTFLREKFPNPRGNTTKYSATTMASRRIKTKYSATTMHLAK
jgi:hypothetical protein